MNVLAAAGAGFLLAVLWFDLMFDVQIRRSDEAARKAALGSISAYYRRVTTEARPMNSLVPAMMFITLGAIGLEAMQASRPWWIVWPSLALAASAIGLAMVRTVGKAVRLGTAKDTTDVQLRLARIVYQDHVYCFAAIAGLIVLQLLPL